MDVFPKLKICTGYKLDGKVTDNFPASVTALERCEPVYEEVPGWETPTSDARKFTDLALNAQRYIKRLEELTGCPVGLISVGARREETIVRESPL
jgi:adenylosuccinate synthase